MMTGSWSTMVDGRRVWSGTVYGEPASKANSRRIAAVGRGKYARRIIKSEKALGYTADFAKQVRTRVVGAQLRGRLRMTIRIFYRTERPDLDETLILDLLQGRVYSNDRQVRERHVYHAIDRDHPRAEILLEEIGS